MARGSGQELLAGLKLGPCLNRIFFLALSISLMVCAPSSVGSAQTSRLAKTAPRIRLSPAIGAGNTTAQFIDEIEYATGGGPAGIAAGDLNHDGFQDVVTANSADNSVSVLLGRGDGTFATRVDYATGKGPSSVAIADLNGDGKLDLVVTNSTDNSVSVLKGNGDGTFQAHTDRPANALPQSVAVADFNHDQKPDLVLVNLPGSSGQGNISVLIGNGDGTFQNPVQYQAAVGTTSLTVADLNSDGIADVVVANSDNMFVTTGALNVFIGKGDGTFRTSTTYDLGRGASSVAVADLNGDGKVDLIVSTFDRNTIPGPDSVTVLLGSGGGAFGQPNSFVIDAGGSIIAADFDGDGQMDVAVASPSTNTVCLLLGAGDGTFRSQTNFGSGDSPAGLVAADFNGDGHIDLVTPNQSTNSVGLLLGNGDGSFQARIDYAVTEQPVSLAVADFNGDGKPDLVSADTYGEGVSILLGNGDGSFQTSSLFATDLLPVALVAADFDGDGKVDVATASVSQTTVSVLLGKGDGTFQPHVEYGAIQLPRSMAAGDFNGDGKPDLVVVGSGVSGNGGVGILMNKGDGTFLPVSNLGGMGSGVAVADFNGDSKDDLVIVDGTNIHILLGNGNGTFQTPASISDGSTPGVVAVGDFNSDGKADLVVVNGGNNQSISVLFGNGNGTFQAHVDYPTGQFPGNVAVGDFDGDGKADIAVGDPTGLSIFTNKGDGTFEPRAEYSSGVAPVAIAAGDFDLDGKLDLATTNLLTSPLSYVGQYLPGSVGILLNGRGAIVAIHPSENPSAIGAPITFTTTVRAALPGALSPTGSVTLQDGNTTLGTAGLTGNSAAFSAPALAAGVHVMSARYSGDQNFRASSTVLRQAVVAPDFSLSSSAVTPASVSAGQSASATVTVTSIAGFSGSVSLSCSVSPSTTDAPACSLSPATVQSAADSSATSTLNISTAAPHLQLGSIQFPSSGWRMGAFWFPVCGIAVLGLLGLHPKRGLRRKPVISCWFPVPGLWESGIWTGLILAGLLGLQACGGSQSAPSGGSSAGSYVISIEGTSGGTKHSVSVTLSVH